VIWNVAGSLLLMAIFSVGALVFYMVLRTKAFDNAPMRGTSVDTLRQNFKYIVAFELVVGAIAGWFVGPIVFETLGAS
jgi:formate hydrogenlyase subunit 3/multisubunit Na+/H+ antiporter MnhD subunit